MTDPAGATPTGRGESLFRDLRSARSLYLKASLLLVVGTVASALVLVESPRWQTAFLLAIAIWAFCRAYYFAFYVVEHYADPGYRFAGLIDFARYLLSSRREKPPTDAE